MFKYTKILLLLILLALIQSANSSKTTNSKKGGKSTSKTTSKHPAPPNPCPPDDHDQFKCYTALIDPSTSDGATGYFQMAYSTLSNSATYKTFLDLTNFEGYDASTCNIANGLVYHAHSFWNSKTSTSSSNTFCSSSYTGGHHDPTFGCSQTSQWSSTHCDALERTLNDGYRYRETCTISNYEDGFYQYCEVGDISGKFGSLVVNTDANDVVYTALTSNDPMPPLISTFKAVDVLGNCWSSVVFHCKDDGKRLVCGELIESEGKCKDLGDGGGGWGFENGGVDGGGGGGGWGY